MNSKTASVVIPVGKKKVFSYLSDIENLPKWATEFAQELKSVDGKQKIVTPMGEMFISIRADEASGVIDIFAGPSEDQMGVFPSRVVELPGGYSAYLFTMFQSPDVSDEEFEGQFESLTREFDNIKRIFAEA